MRKVNKISIAFLIMILFMVSFSSSTLAIKENPKSGISNVKLYYVNENSQMLQMIETVLTVPEDATQNIEKFTMQALMDTNNVPHNAYSPIPEGLKINDVTVKNKIMYIDFSSNFESAIDNNVDMSAMLKSILSTAFQFEHIDGVIFTSNGNSLGIINDSDFSQAFMRNIAKDQFNTTLFEGKTKADEFVLLSIPDIPDPVIVIDPGHGGCWPGTDYNDIYYEKDINLAVAKKLRTYLENKGATVIMTRETDTHFSTDLGEDLDARVQIAKNNNADIFISVHANGGPSSAYGSTVIYPNNHDISLSHSLADLIHQQVLLLSDLEERSQPYEDYKNLYVLRYTDMPAVITECGFVTNSSDIAILTSESGQDDIAKGIYVGIRKWWWGY